MEAAWTWRRAGEGPWEALRAAIPDSDPARGELLARLLWNRGVESAEAAESFLCPTLARGLRPPSMMLDLDRAAARLADAIARHERVAVYGDYDVDGVTGAAQVVLFLREVGAEPLLHVSHRTREGYGLDAEALRRLKAAGARVVVTADVGTAASTELLLARELELDVIVCDHHHVPPTRPPAFAVLNPLQPECGFPFKGLSGAGVVFYLLMGLRAELRRRDWPRLPDLRRYLDLVALGTVGDVVPLRDENRVLVAHGLREIERTERPGLRALKEVALVDCATVRAIGFRIGPRLNAAGRLAEAGIAVEALTTADPEYARSLVAELEVFNAQRRAIEEEMMRRAIDEIERGGEPGPAIVVANGDFHAGVAGIVAARLAERYRRPALVIALDGEVGRGSGRSVRGVALLEHLHACKELLEAYGGHPYAAGLRVQARHVGALRQRFVQSVGEGGGHDGGATCIEVDAEVSFAQVSPRLVHALALLEPHGPGNPEPRLLARGVRVEGVRLVGSPAAPHLRLRLRQDGTTLPGIGFRLGHLPIRAGDRVDAVFTPRIGRWGDTRRLEVEVAALWAHPQLA